MDPFTIMFGHAIAAALAPHLAALAIAAATVVLAITIEEIRNWFVTKQELIDQHQQAIGFTIAAKLGSRDFTEVKGVFRTTEAPNRIVQGIYDTKTKEILAIRKIASKKADAEVVARHANGELVVYT